MNRTLLYSVAGSSIISPNIWASHIHEVNGSCEARQAYGKPWQSSGIRLGGIPSRRRISENDSLRDCRISFKAVRPLSFVQVI